MMKRERWEVRRTCTLLLAVMWTVVLVGILAGAPGTGAAVTVGLVVSPLLLVLQLARR